MKQCVKAKLVLEDGTSFKGISFGARGENSGEVVFNTAMSGYQEILTDPSYKGQIVTMTYPLIGNYGVNAEDVESNRVFLEGFVVREASRIASNWRSQKSLREYFQENNIMGIEGVDTRALTKHVREKGAMKAVISTEDLNDESLREKAINSAGLIGRDLVKEVTSEHVYDWNDTGKYTVVVIDCGVKLNILRELVKHNCLVKVVPAGTSAETIMDMAPHGVLVSNGPGDPEGVPYLMNTVKTLMKQVPIFGICLGHQILALATGNSTYKLKFGHHGVNHPVKDLRTGKVYITVQNHGFCVKTDLLNREEIEVTHINLNDNTVEGIKYKKFPVFSVQFHPEASSGPHEAVYLFKEFIDLIKGNL
ncbi:MAG: glutamine-hydrolyzing carbamoyl-phosphate synthase small subunit [Candidatus Omnitrophota bacterium]|nr:glutamine-hydrolyzing carbamoyl-phosphate synthase small subunit [Candidatus Omnitrophota bacterium]